MGAPSRASGEQVHQARLARGEPDHRFSTCHTDKHMDKHITIPMARLTELETAERERDELRELLNQSPARSTALSGAKGLNVTENPQSRQPAPVLLSEWVGSWLPITTALKDRTEVILFAPDEDPSVFTAMYIGDWCRSSSGQYKPNNDLYGDREITAVAWMPMPAPPANAKRWS